MNSPRGMSCNFDSAEHLDLMAGSMQRRASLRPTMNILQLVHISYILSFSAVDLLVATYASSFPSCEKLAGAVPPKASLKSDPTCDRWVSKSRPRSARGGLIVVVSVLRSGTCPS